MKRMLLGATALVALGALPQSASSADSRPLATSQPDPQIDVAPYFVSDSDPRWSSSEWSAADIAALREKIKYVFVIFNENRSFDHEYGSFPGANGLYSDGLKPRSPADTPGFVQTYLDRVTGQLVSVQPFLVGPAQNASFKDSTDHSHKGLAAKIDVEVKDGVPTARMDRFAEVEWRRYASAGGEKGEKQGTQFARLVMAHVDCDTIPFFWRYASRFTIFDNIFATEDTPSTPNAVAMIAGQSGETQWVKHPASASNPAATGFTGAITGTINGKSYSGIGTTEGPPLVDDPQPWWGSEFDSATAAVRQPTSPDENWDPTNIASNLTFASLPLTMMGGWIDWFTAQDRNPEFDLADVKKDIPAIAAAGTAPVAWRWYQNGYDLEPTDTTGVASHIGYVSHHNGPQYFGYVVEQSCRAGQPARRRRLLRRHREPHPADDRRGLLSPRRLLQPSVSEGHGRHPKPELPESQGADRGRTGQDHPLEIGRRRPSELFGQPADRGDGGARHQRDRGEQGHLGEERDHHRL